MVERLVRGPASVSELSRPLDTSLPPVLRHLQVLQARRPARGPEGGPAMTFETLYRDIVPEQRIVYTSTLSTETDLWTVSLTTVEFTPGEDGGARLVLTEQGAFLGGQEQPAWREHGTADQLEAL